MLTPLKDYEISKFECNFAENVHLLELQALLEVAQGLMRLLSYIIALLQTRHLTCYGTKYKN